MTALPSGGSNWNVKVFEHLNGSRYRYTLHEEDIVEVSFPLRQVVAALHAHYAKVRVIDPDRTRPSVTEQKPAEYIIPLNVGHTDAEFQPFCFYFISGDHFRSQVLDVEQMVS